MKRVLFLFLLTTFQTASAQNTLFAETGYAATLTRAKAEHKPIFYMIHASWCPHCQRMKATVFTDPEVIAFLRQNFICAWQDVDQGEGEMLKKKFGVKAFPTFLFLDEDGNILYNINGEYKSAELLAEAQNALIPEKQLPYLEKQFNADPGNADKCLAYLTTLKKGKDRTFLSAPAQKYLSTQTDAQLVSETNWRIIANAVTDIKSREFQYVLKHQDEFAAVSSAVRVKRKIVNIVTELLVPYTESLDTLGYKKQREIAKSIGLQKTDSLIFSYDIILAERTQDWGAYRRATIGSVEKYIWDSAKLLKETGQVYVQHLTDPESTKYALKWVRRALDVTESADGNLLMARLYLKINERKSAVVYAQKAKDINTAMGWNSKDGEALFNELGIR